MKGTIPTLALGALLGISVCALGFWAGRRTGQHEVKLAREIRLQGESLAHLAESVSELAQSAKCSGTEVSTTAPSRPTVAASIIEVAVRRALEEQRRQDRETQQSALRPTEENLRAFAGGEEIVSKAIAAKRWTEDDKLLLRELMGQMTANQHAELMRQLSVAINQQRVTIQSEGPPF